MMTAKRSISSTIEITAPMLSMKETLREVLSVVDGTAKTDNGELSDGAARSIAALYQSSGSIGSVMASLASGCAVNRDELLADISDTARQAMGTTSLGWPADLELLSMWVLDHE